MLNYFSSRSAGGAVCFPHSNAGTQGQAAALGSWFRGPAVWPSSHLLRPSVREAGGVLLPAPPAGISVGPWGQPAPPGGQASCLEAGADPSPALCFLRSPLTFVGPVVCSECACQAHSVLGRAWPV